MKIDNTGKPLASATSRTSDARKPSGGEAVDSSAAAGTQPKNNVKLDAFTGRLQQLEASLVNQPVVDESRVAEIRKAISEGRFNVRADAIADKLMASVRELLANKN